MPTDPLTSSRYPDAGYVPNVFQDIQNAVFDLSEHTIPYFTTTTARNTAYANWVTAGGVWRKGMYCHVNDDLYQSQATVATWNVVPTAQENRMMRAQRGIDTPLVSGTFTSFASDTNWTEVDTWNMRGSGATLTAPWTGWYQMNASVRFQSNATGRRSLAFIGTGTTNIGNGAAGVVMTTQIPAVNGAETAISGSILVPLVVGEGIQLQGFQDSGVSINVAAIWISAVYLGPNT